MDVGCARDVCRVTDDRGIDHLDRACGGETTAPAVGRGTSGIATDDAAIEDDAAHRIDAATTRILSPGRDGQVAAHLTQPQRRDTLREDAATNGLLEADPLGRAVTDA